LDPDSPLQLLDGRNRLDAIEIATGKTAIKTRIRYETTSFDEWLRVFSPQSP